MPGGPTGQDRDPVGGAGESPPRGSEWTAAVWARAARACSLSSEEARPGLVRASCAICRLSSAMASVLACQRQPRLGRAAPGHVVGGDLGSDRDAQRLAVVPDRSAASARAASIAAADSAEQIHLPARVGADAEGRAVSCRRRRSRPGAARGTDSRHQPGPRLHQRLARLHQPAGGDLREIEIVRRSASPISRVSSGSSNRSHQRARSAGATVSPEAGRRWCQVVRHLQACEGAGGR